MQIKKVIKQDIVSRFQCSGELSIQPMLNMKSSEDRKHDTLRHEFSSCPYIYKKILRVTNMCIYIYIYIWFSLSSKWQVDASSKEQNAVDFTSIRHLTSEPLSFRRKWRNFYVYFSINTLSATWSVQFLGRVTTVCVCVCVIKTLILKLD